MFRAGHCEMRGNAASSGEMRICQRRCFVDAVLETTSAVASSTPSL
jgi:hypothetical protein